MTKNYVLSEYVEQAMELAEYDKLEEDSFSGRIQLCKGVIAFALHSEFVRMNCVQFWRTGFLSV